MSYSKVTLHQRLQTPAEFLPLRKPLIERKRRERINNCLDQLKETVIGQSKLEKADILEMTVKHLQNIQNNTLNGEGVSRQDVSLLTSQGFPASPLRRDAPAGRQRQKEGPPGQVAELQERSGLHSSHLGMLEMWRPW
uniref:BHLH domain-containing protein n=1 Tax=Xiphophorus couchianus TaxID=32473 RepID=A0A3B5LD15_9TELE